MANLVIIIPTEYLNCTKVLNQRMYITVCCISIKLESVTSNAFHNRISVVFQEHLHAPLITHAILR